MTGNKHAEARRGSFDPYLTLRSVVAQVGVGALAVDVLLLRNLLEIEQRHRLAALNTRPDVEAMREACARVAVDAERNWRQYRDTGGVTFGAERLDETECDIASRVACGIAATIRSIPVPTSGEGGAPSPATFASETNKDRSGKHGSEVA